jgi:endonuclease/exonuclease/phosphatase (EEP) superfamily protein YafD
MLRLIIGLKKRWSRIIFVFTLFSSLFLVAGCVFVLKGSNVFAFIFSIVLPMLFLLNVVFLLYWLIKKKKVLLVPFFSLTVFFLCFSSFVQFNSNKERTKKTFSLLSYNTREFNSDNDIAQKGIDHAITDFINQQDADIVFIQEFLLSKSEDFNEYPYRFVAHRISKNKTLLTVFSKFPIVNKDYIDFPNTLNNAIFVDIEYDGEVIRIYNLHLQSFGIEMNSDKLNSNRYGNIISKISKARKMQFEQSQMILNHIKSFDGKVIIAGDFNSTQFSSTYKTLKDSRKDTFVEAGFGLGTTYKLFSYPLRLDYLLVDDDFDVVSHQNFELKLSDHEPVFAELVKN